MPVDVTSRYWTLPSYEVPDEAGHTTALPERPLPPVAGLDMYNHRLTGVENVEYLAWRYFGNSGSWWHIADANALTFPLDYRPGATVRVPPARGVGRVLRTRSF
jgi:hypothetical protein